MRFLKALRAGLRTLGAYLRDLGRSWWFFVCLGGTLFGLAGPFLPPLQSAIPPWVGLVVALCCWTLAPVHAYHQLRQRLAEARATVTVSQGDQGVVVTGPVNVTNNYTIALQLVTRSTGGDVVVDVPNRSVNEIVDVVDAEGEVEGDQA